MSLAPSIIDISGLLEGHAPAVARVAVEIAEPCQRLGLFQIVGHGISSEELTAFDGAMRAFFALHGDAKNSVRRSRDNAWGYYDEELTKNRPDWKEVFDYGTESLEGRARAAHSDGVNRWPKGETQLQRTLLHHHSACTRIARALLKALATSLELAQSRLDQYFEDDSSFTRLNYYPRCEAPAAPDAPPIPATGHLGVHPHSDAGAFTLLYQDEVSSLQVWDGNVFETVQSEPGALTVNLGDMLRVWSNDRYRSPVHRVLARTDRERFSAPFFFNPRYDTLCSPLAGREESRFTPRFREVSWAHFRDQRSAGDFADYGSEIQVEDFLVETGAPL